MSKQSPWWSSGEPEPENGNGQENGHDNRRTGSREAAADATAPHHSSEVCGVCPVCSVLRILEDTRPEVIGHLTEAARHMTLAAKAVIDAHAEHLRADGGLQHIPLDDD